MLAVSIFFFLLYHNCAICRQNLVEMEADRTDAIVSALFSGRLREMVMQQDPGRNVGDDTMELGITHLDE